MATGNRKERERIASWDKVQGQASHPNDNNQTIPRQYPKDADEYMQYALNMDPQQGPYATLFIAEFYCRQLLAVELDRLVYRFVSDLIYFQRRVHQQQPTKARSKRRLIAGLHECYSHAQMAHLRMLLVAIDVDTETRCKKEWHGLLQLARRNAVPTVFALSRSELASTFGRPSANIAVLGVLSMEGAHALYQQIAAMALQLQQQWRSALVERIRADLAHPSQIFSPALHASAAHGHLDVLEQVGNGVASLINQIEPRSGATLAISAAQTGNVRLMELLTGLGVDLTLRDFCLSNVLHMATRHGYVDLVHAILGLMSEMQRRETLQSRDALGATPLVYAIRTGSRDLVKLLLHQCQPFLAGFNFLLSDISANATLLAATDPLVLQELLRGNLVDPSLDQLHHLLMHISRRGSLESLRVLVRFLSDQEKSKEKVTLPQLSSFLDRKLDEHGGTAAWWAAYLGHLAVARELISLGADGTFSSLVDGIHFTVLELISRWNRGKDRYQ